MLFPLGQGVVERVFRTGQELFVATRGEKEAPFFLVFEIGDHAIDERLCFAQPARFTSGAVQAQETVRRNA